MSKQETQANILEAAADIVQTDGIRDLTLEGTAKRAGISKGGLLYHFPSKDALIQGMIQRLMQDYNDFINREANGDSSLQGKWTRSFIKGTFQQSSADQSMDAGLMAAAGINPELLEPVQEAYESWQANIDQDGLDPVNATILRLAVDGLWFSEIFGLAPLNETRRHYVLERLIQMTREE